MSLTKDQQIQNLEQRLDAALRLCDDITALPGKPLRFYSRYEICKMLKIETRTFTGQVKRFDMPCFKVGGRWRICELSFLEWIKKMEALPKPPAVLRRLKKKAA